MLFIIIIIILFPLPTRSQPKVLYINYVVHTSQLLLLQHLYDSFVRSDKKYLLDRHYVSASTTYESIYHRPITYIVTIIHLSLPLTVIIVIIIVITPTTLDNNVGLQSQHVVTKCLNVHEVISDLYISNILFRKVFICWVYMNLTFRVVTYNIWTLW